MPSFVADASDVLRHPLEHMDRPFLCSHPSCGASFKTASALKKHGVYHTDVKPFVCTHEDGCLKTFFTLTHLERHLATHNKPSRTYKTYKCSHCEISFRHKFNLKVHEAVHTGYKPFKCDQCDASFALRGRLKKHLKTHSGYSCEQCDFKGDTWSALRIHAQCHRMECPHCHRLFASGSTLERHLAKHVTKGDEKKIFQCPQCPLSYQKSSNLKAHIKSIHEKVKHSCDICAKEFSFKHTLIKHLEREHRPRVLTDATNDKKKRKKGVTKKRKLLAITLSGYEKAAIDTREQLLLEDKKFRKENPAVQQ